MQFTANLYHKAFCGTLHLHFRATRSLSVSIMSTSNQPSDTPTGSNTTATPKPVPLVMQIVVRRDLLAQEGWGVGPLMAQVAHATSAVGVDGSVYFDANVMHPKGPSRNERAG